MWSFTNGALGNQLKLINMATKGYLIEFVFMQFSYKTDIWLSLCDNLLSSTIPNHTLENFYCTPSLSQPVLKFYSSPRPGAVLPGRQYWCWVHFPVCAWSVQRGGRGLEVTNFLALSSGRVPGLGPPPPPPCGAVRSLVLVQC